MTQAIGVSSLLMVVPAALAGAFHPQLLRLPGCSTPLMPLATDYLLLLLPGCLCLLLQSIGMLLIRLDGAPRFAMMCNVVPAQLNLVLDYLFIFPLHWGVGGAALATSIGTFTGGAMVVWYFVRRSHTLRFWRLKLSPTSLRLTLRNAGYILRLGSPAFLGEVAMSVMMLTGNYVFMSTLGEDGVAAYSVACYLFPLVFMMSNAVAQSAQPILSFNHGAGHEARVRTALHTSLVAGVACGLLATVLIAACARPIAALFIAPGCGAYGIAAEGLPLFAASALFFALNVVFIGYYQSLERSFCATAFMMLRGIVLLVPAFLILPAIAGHRGAWLAIPRAETLTLLVIVACHTLGQIRQKIVAQGDRN